MQDIYKLLLIIGVAVFVLYSFNSPMSNSGQLQTHPQTHHQQGECPYGVNNDVVAHNSDGSSSAHSGAAAHGAHPASQPAAHPSAHSGSGSGSPHGSQSAHAGSHPAAHSGAQGSHSAHPSAGASHPAAHAGAHSGTQGAHHPHASHPHAADGIHDSPATVKDHSTPESSFCSPNSQLNSQDLLPNADFLQWAKLHPTGTNELNNRNFLTAGHHIGINTVGQSLRNGNLQIRSEPPNPQVAVSPWLQTTIGPDINRKALEIGENCVKAYDV